MVVAVLLAARPSSSASAGRPSSSARTRNRSVASSLPPRRPPARALRRHPAAAAFFFVPAPRRFPGDDDEAAAAGDRRRGEPPDELPHRSRRRTPGSVARSRAQLLRGISPGEIDRVVGSPIYIVPVGLMRWQVGPTWQWVVGGERSGCGRVGGRVHVGTGGTWTGTIRHCFFFSSSFLSFFFSSISFPFLCIASVARNFRAFFSLRYFLVIRARPHATK